MATLSSPIYMKSYKFDVFFVVGIPILALLTAAIAVLYPAYFPLILTLDLTLLGYHHVISTYTRLVFDWQSAKEYWLLLVPLPIAVICSVYIVALNFGVEAIATIYLHWQWYHYTRQSEGINKLYGIKTRSVEGEAGNPRFNRYVFYMVPVAAFLMMSSRSDYVFLGMNVWKIPIPSESALALLLIAGLFFSFWLVVQIKAWMRGTLSSLHFAYLLSHYIIYIVAYVAIDNITVGWIAINIWHNSQYIAFVWLFNTNKFKDGVDKKRPLISWMSQENRWPVYLVICLIVTYCIYSAVDFSAVYFSDMTALSLIIIFYQTINFHHYIVDSLIWKLRSKKLQTVMIS